MGYSHYWTLHCTEEQFVKGMAKATPALNDILERHKSIIQFESDDPKPPVLTSTQIRFNGIGEEGGHETFMVAMKERSDFCKTARKPYDLPVCECLLVLLACVLDFELSSDGFWVNADETNPPLDGCWDEALDSVEERYGYKFKRNIERHEKGGHKYAKYQLELVK